MQPKNLLATLASLALLASAPDRALAQHEQQRHEMHGSGGAVAQLQLQDGRKWQTDAALRLWMANICAAFDADHPAIHTGEANRRAVRRARDAHRSAGEVDRRKLPVAGRCRCEPAPRRRRPAAGNFAHARRGCCALTSRRCSGHPRRAERVWQVYWILGGLILVRQGATRLSLAVSLAQLAIPIAMISDTNTVYASYPGLILPSIFLSSLGMIALLLFSLPVSQRAILPALCVDPLRRGSFSNRDQRYPGIYRIRFYLAAQTPFFLALVILIAFALVFQILRYRRASTPLERQQTKWILYGLFVFFLGFPLWLIIFGGLVDLPTGSPGLMMILIGWALAMVMLMALPVTIAITILRYRLWDIDLIIRKTLIYGALTVLLGLIYFGGVLGLQFLFSSVLTLDSGKVTIVVTTLAIAALFAPLRRRVQNSIDRRFYRRKYNAERVLAEFSETLANSSRNGMQRGPTAKYSRNKDSANQKSCRSDCFFGKRLKLLSSWDKAA